MVQLIQQTMVHFAASEVAIASSRVHDSWMWYVIRASGFTAAALLFLLMLSGIGQVTGLTYRFLEPIKAWMLHKAMALALCAAVAVHAGFLLFDKFLPFSLAQILVPFVSHYSNGTSLLSVGLSGVAVALGILAMYAIAVVVATSLGWIDSKKRLWRQTHYLSYFIVLAVFIHALGTGSDLKYGLFRSAWIAAGLLLVIGIISRLRRARSLKK